MSPPPNSCNSNSGKINVSEFGFEDEEPIQPGFDNSAKTVAINFYEPNPAYKTPHKQNLSRLRIKKSSVKSFKSSQSLRSVKTKESPKKVAQIPQK